MNFQKPKGTMDLIYDDSETYLFLQNVIEQIADMYNFHYIETPIFENSELFHRTVGETSDIVTKETYDFLDKGGRNLTLKPEGTAGVVRSFIENKMTNQCTLPLKLYYITKCFRYERPQSGRLRQHTQFGVEVFGSDNVLVDADIIKMLDNFYGLIGLKNIKFKINSLGDGDSQKKYTDVLVKYLLPFKEKLCHDCQQRLEKNPLRVLDCKVDADSDILKNAPKTIDYLNDESKTRFLKLQEYLATMNINYKVDYNLVRGLDYYTHTVFEAVDNENNLTLCGGGRYNNLVASLGGPDTPAMGFGMGLERLLLVLKQKEIILTNPQLDIYIINLCKEEISALVLADSLRMSGYKTEIDYLTKNLKGQFKIVDRLNPRYIIFLGDDELEHNVVKIKDNVTKETDEVVIDEIINYLDSK